MPKYYEFKIAGYYLYFTSYCVIKYKCFAVITRHDRFYCKHYT